MIKQLKKYVLIICSLVTLSAPILLPVAAGATCSGDIQKQIGVGIQSTGTNTSGCGGSSADTGISSIARKVIDLFSLIVGIVSVIMIVYAGFRYITSGGDSGNTTGARNTLLFAILGLIIVAIAQIIVRFVLHTASGIQ